MYDLEHVTKLLYGASFRIKEINPYDYCFQHLNVKLRPLGFNDLDFNLILRYVNQTFDQNKPEVNNNFKWTVHNIFALDHKNNKVDSHQKELDEEFNKLHNHYMLFHGTRNANVLSIMEQGLRITPSNSIVYHGSSYGEGVYMADMANISFSVSPSYHHFVQYTDFSERDDCYMFVVEAALGNVLNCISVSLLLTKWHSHFNFSTQL